MTTKADSPGERRWRWFLRGLGAAMLVWSATLYTLNGEVLVIFPLIGGWAIGADAIQGFEVRRRERNGE
jgi:hypothetical protein